MTGVWQWVLYLHLVAMAFFLGGQLMLAASVVPVERSNPDPERMRAIARRFGYGSLVALAVLIATGVAMASHLNMWDDSTLQTKLGFVVLVIVLVLVHLKLPRAHVLQAAIFLATLATVWLGLDLVV